MDKINNIKYAYFDLDGTLLTSAKKIDSSTLEALKILRNNDIKIGVATGRPHYMCKEELEKIKAELPMISSNGGLIYQHDIDKIYPQRIFNNILTAEIINYFNKNKITFLVYTTEKMYYQEHVKNSQWIKWIKESLAQKNNQYKWKFEKLNSQILETEKVIKFLIMLDDISLEITNKLTDFINDKTGIYFVKSQSMVMDIMPRGNSKGIALLDINKYLKFDLEKTIVFGDGLNDIPMFTESLISVAMGNANETVKKNATYITKNNDKKGILTFVMEHYK